MFKPLLRRTDPFALALVVYALVLACLAVFVGCFNPPAGLVALVVAVLIAAHGVLVQRAARP